MIGLSRNELSIVFTSLHGTSITMNMGIMLHKMINSRFSIKLPWG